MNGYGGGEMGAFSLPNPLSMLQNLGGRPQSYATRYGQPNYATPYGFAQPAPYGMHAAQMQAFHPGYSPQAYAQMPGHCNMPAQPAQGVGRTLAIGFDSVNTVAAAASVIITQRPQVRMQPSRVIIPSAIGGDFLVNDLKIGKNSQFTASSTLPASVFAENAVGVALAMDPCDIAQDISLNVTNISANPARFNAAMIGTSCW